MTGPEALRHRRMSAGHFTVRPRRTIWGTKGPGRIGLGVGVKATKRILHTVTSCVFLKSWNRRVSKESSAALWVVWVWRRQSVIAVLNVAKSA